jgi:hypothetical protein
MKEIMSEAPELVGRLEELAREAKGVGGKGGRSGDEVIIDQMAVFGELLVVLAKNLDEAQGTIVRLTWVILFLTFVLAGDVVARWFHW